MTVAQLDAEISRHKAAADSWKARRHLLDTADLTKPEVECVLSLASACLDVHAEGAAPLAVLQNCAVANLFYENSTRTRSSFELAARKLGASVLNLDIGSSSVSKGESILDTAETLLSMGARAVVQRHRSSGSAHLLAGAIGDRIHVINAGDGWHAHPTQALLDLLSMRQVAGNLQGRKLCIVGDITHSRVARSNLWLARLMGMDVHIAGPPTLMPAALSSLGVTVHNRLEPAIEQADFVMVLRLQLERQKSGLIPSLAEYQRLYRMDHQRLNLCQPGVKVMHPGPINRGVEITDELAADNAYSLVGTQVRNGIAVRMAVLQLLLAGARE